MRLLVVEDDDSVGAPLCAILRHHKFDVVRARTCAEARRAAVAADVVLLDLGLPDGDGIALMTALQREHDLPVIVTTARGDLPSRLHGLTVGADDYLVKPYDVRELVARITALSRRMRRERAAEGPQVHEVAGLRVDEGARTVHDLLGASPEPAGPEGQGVEGSPGKQILLSPKEFDLLAMLAAAGGAVVRREQICAQVWQGTWRDTHRTLEVHVASLRAKLGRPDVVETVRGVGYRLAG
ncbi:MAG TPA: response regulator transcription factor [Motilibacteraceae bacterium]|nr:response regulator transcription factor [Motilibacteraceae bacterium]